MHLLFKTAKRVYFFGVDKTTGLVHVEYRPINPRTGRVWQAARGIPGADAYVLGTYRGIEDGQPPRTTGVVFGKIPMDWHRTAEQWTWANTGFSTFELAEAAAKKHAGVS